MIQCEYRHSPSIGGSSAVGPGASDVGVLVLVAELETQVVHDVSCVLHNIGALTKVSLDGQTTDVLERYDVIGVGSGREAGEDSLLSEQERSGADGKESTPADWKKKTRSAKCVLRDGNDTAVDVAYSRSGLFFWISL